MKRIDIALILALLAALMEIKLSAAPKVQAHQQIVAREYMKPAGSRTFAILRSGWIT